MRCVMSMIFMAAMFATMSARADDVVRKGGEWQSVVTGLAPQPKTVVMCLSQSTWEQAIAKFDAQTSCSRKNISKNGDHLAIDIDCGATALQGTGTLVGDDAYTADLTVHLGTGADAKVMHTVTQAKWIGACKPGEKVVN